MAAAPRVVPVADQPVDEGLRNVLDHREAARHVAVEGRVADPHLALVAGRQDQPSVPVGEGHHQIASDSRLEVLRRQVRPSGRAHAIAGAREQQIVGANRLLDRDLDQLRAEALNDASGALGLGARVGGGHHHAPAILRAPGHLQPRLPPAPSRLRPRRRSEPVRIRFFARSRRAPASRAEYTSASASSGSASGGALRLPGGGCGTSNRPRRRARGSRQLPEPSGSSAGRSGPRPRDTSADQQLLGELRRPGPASRLGRRRRRCGRAARVAADLRRVPRPRPRPPGAGARRLGKPSRCPPPGPAPATARAAAGGPAGRADAEVYSAEAGAGRESGVRTGAGRRLGRGGLGAGGTVAVRCSGAERSVAWSCRLPRWTREKPSGRPQRS